MDDKKTSQQMLDLPTKSAIVAVPQNAVQSFAGEKTFLARALILATLPHDNPGDGVVNWERINGKYRLLMQADPELGLPFGTYPRLFLAWLCREAKRKRSRQLEIGELYPFLEQLRLNKPGAKTASLFVKQAERLLGCRMRFKWEHDFDEDTATGRTFINISDNMQLWTPRDAKGTNTKQSGLFPFYVELTEPFFREINEHSVPLDMDIIAQIKSSSLALDLYSWLTYRTYTLGGKTARISWGDLAAQFGSNYAEQRVFRFRFKKALERVTKLYPVAGEVTTEAFILKPGKPSVARIDDSSDPY